MDRRAFIAGTLGLIAAPLAAEAQPAGKLYRIGFLSAGETPPFGPLGLSWSLGAFRQGFHALGYVDGRDFLIESRPNVEALRRSLREPGYVGWTDRPGQRVAVDWS